MSTLCSGELKNVTNFELIQDIIETNLLTKFHEDWTINANVDVAQRTMHDPQRTTDKRRSQKLTMSTLCSGELKRRPKCKTVMFSSSQPIFWLYVTSKPT
ncbi:hypothetical protein DPMN_082443 [Dreissena polymorpha]|uniref:Uncharacterized protein n=1 Tax=Dreissena polymorpha TaxID=45954 RepID=A0A9D3Y9A2_DREPO|nr:hypothetical protein DPMN_082443 [Dreissena polymorpha]